MKRSRKDRKYSNHSKITWDSAPDVKRLLKHVVSKNNLHWIKTSYIACLRSKNSSSRAIARIWGLPSVWQKVLKKDSHYIIEVLSEKYDKLNETQKVDVLLHELAHIPKNFSGALVPHFRKGPRKFDQIIKSLKNNI